MPHGPSVHYAPLPFMPGAAHHLHTAHQRLMHHHHRPHMPSVNQRARNGLQVDYLGQANPQPASLPRCWLRRQDLRPAQPHAWQGRPARVAGGAGGCGTGRRKGGASLGGSVGGPHWQSGAADGPPQNHTYAVRRSQRPGMASPTALAAPSAASYTRPLPAHARQPCTQSARMYGTGCAAGDVRGGSGPSPPATDRAV